MTTTAGKLAEFRRRRDETLAPAGEAAVEKQHNRGKHTARERIEMLLKTEPSISFNSLSLKNSLIGLFVVYLSYVSSIWRSIKSAI